MGLKTAGGRLFFDAEEYFSGLLQDIHQACEEIILETYIFRLDALGWRFVQALQQACSRGVRIRLLIDGVGSYLDTNRLVDELESERCRICIFHPLPWDFRAYRNALIRGKPYSQWLYYLASINRRDHRKLCIIDGRVAWLGSFNITADHYNSDSQNGDGQWHDTGLRTDTDVVEDLKQNFEEVWHRKGSSPGGRARQFLAIGAIDRRRSIRREIVELIGSATRRVWITNAYFSPSRPVLRCLKQASRNGCSVKLIVPSRSDISWFPFVARTYYADLLGAGIRVFEFSQTVLHSKTLLLDDSLIVGSTNLNYRSFFHDLEVDALVSDQAMVESMEARFEADITGCREITLKSWRRYPVMLKLLGWIPRLLRYWI